MRSREDRRLHGPVEVRIGGAFGDRIDGGADEDLIFGDNVYLDRNTGSETNPRYRQLSGGLIYDNGVGSATAGQVLVTDAEQNVPGGAAVWEDFGITLLDHSDSDQAAGLDNFGIDYIAGGADADQIFGQLGDDTIQGDGSIDLAADAGASRNETTGFLEVSTSLEAASDGDDYVEGGGGNDIIFGNLGRDDLIGGSSELFSLDVAGDRPDGADLIFGGAGTDIARNGTGDGSHAADSDMILGDNGNIFRLVDEFGTTSGLVTLEDSETGETIVVDTASARFREGFRQSGGESRKRREDLLRSLKVDELPIETGKDYLPALTRFFRMREKRAAR